MSISGSDDLNYDSDATISEDWEAMYHPHVGKHGSNHDAAVFAGSSNVGTRYEEASFFMADMLPEHSPSARKRMKVYVAEPFAGQPQDPLRVVEAHPRRDGESQLYPKVPASYNVGGGLGSRFWKANSWEKSESSREPKPTPTQSPKFPRRGKFLFQPSSSRRALFLPNTVDEGADNITLRHTVSLNRSQLQSIRMPPARGIVQPKRRRRRELPAAVPFIATTALTQSTNTVLPSEIARDDFAAVTGSSSKATDSSRTPIEEAAVVDNSLEGIDQLGAATPMVRSSALAPQTPSPKSHKLKLKVKPKVAVTVPNELAPTTPSPPRIILRTNSSPDVKARLAAVLHHHNLDRSSRLATSTTTVVEQRKSPFTGTRASKRKATSVVNVKSALDTDHIIIHPTKKRKSSKNAKEASAPDEVTSITPPLILPAKRKASAAKIVLNTNNNKRASTAQLSKMAPPKRASRVDLKPQVEDEDEVKNEEKAQGEDPEDEIEGHDEDEVDDADDEAENDVKQKAAPVPVMNPRSTRAARRNGWDWDGEEDLDLPNHGNSKSRRNPVESWSEPKGKDWDIRRFIIAVGEGEIVIPDNLLRLPPKNFSYFDKDGKLKDPNKYNDLSKPKPRSPELHPKYLAHLKNGTETDSNRQYYEGLSRESSRPIAGITYMPPTGSGWKPGTQYKGPKAQQKKAPGTKIREEVVDRDPVVQDMADDSSSLSSVPSSFEEDMFPNLKAAPLQKTPLRTPSNTQAEDDKQIQAQVPMDRYALALAELRKRRLTFFKIQEDTFQARPMVQLPVPDHIKAILVDDWENVTKSQQLVPLPAKVSVNTILDDFVKWESTHRAEGTAEADLLPEVVSGLKEYFEKCLGRVLLYRFERSQYQEVRDGFTTKGSDFEGKSVCDVYGAEHLCRLIVSLPELIAQTNMDNQSVNRLREELIGMTNWLGRNTMKYFTSEYETPGAEYIEKARNG